LLHIMFQIFESFILLYLVCNALFCRFKKSS